MQFRILGALEAGADGAIAELGPPKQRAVLAILLVHVGQIVPTERLIDLLWGDEAPRTAAHSVQIYVSELRKALEPLAQRQVIVTRQPGYQLDVPAEAVDAWQFERLVEEGRRRLDEGDTRSGVSLLRAAIQLWRGPALSDFTYEEFAQPYIRRFHDGHLDAIEALAKAELEDGRLTEALSLLESAVREDPLRERSRELLMLSLYRAGRHAEALRTFDRLRELLADELGLDPSPALRQLRDRILLHDPALMPSRPVAQASASARNPYKGLRSFGEDDAQDFFGRDALVGQILESLAAGAPVVALVGPSGSGKSSAIAAGLMPRLRSGAVAGSAEWLIAQMVPGSDPLREANALLALQLENPVSPESDALVPASLGDRRALLIIDHFEQVFVLADHDTRQRFLQTLARALTQGGHRLSLVLAMRADYYDRPLQHPEFAEIFVAGVVNVLPMAPGELEEAIVAPAARAGVHIERALLAELVAETVERPGSLPLLQYMLTELFEHRAGTTLNVTAYRSLGGLRGVLSRRAESLFSSLSADEQAVATQTFLRMTRAGRAAADSRRRVALLELTELGVDPVALSEVLTAFGRHRLLTFDRDPFTGEATVEVAHEALLSEWQRLAGWIDRHRLALRRREALVAAVDEWETAGRHPDYLPTGSRLEEFTVLAEDGGLQLTSRERSFLDMARRAREAELVREASRAATQRRLERSARLRLVALGLAVLLLGGVAIYSFLAAAGGTSLRVAIAWITDWGLVDRQALAGFDRAVGEFGLSGKKLVFADLIEDVEQELGRPLTDEDVENPQARRTFYRVQEAQFRQLAEEGNRLIIVVGVIPDELRSITKEYPETHFAFADDVHAADNIAQLSFAEQEAAYLAGAAAALESESGVIGFVGGFDWPGVWRFEAGYIAGAQAVRPQVEVLVEYIGDFVSESLAEEAAREMYARGADVIMHAAGNAGPGLFQAALAMSAEQDRHLWAIGVDTDQYQTVLNMPGAVNAQAWQSHILTSVTKAIDRAVYQLVAEEANGRFRAGSWNWGLEEGGMDISYSGGYIDDIRPTLENLKTRVIAGDIEVACVPQRVRAEAIRMGIDPETCTQ